MKHVVSVVLFLALGAGSAMAQGNRERELEKIQKNFEGSMKRLEDKFKQERAALEKEFKAARERLQGRKTPTPHRFKVVPKKRGDDLRNMEEFLKRILDQAKRGFERGRDFPQPPKVVPRVAPKGFERKLDEVLKRLERLEKRLEGEGRKPEYRQFRWQGPKDFEFDFDFRDFKNFERFIPRSGREWKEWLPKFRYEFRRKFGDRGDDKDQDY